MQHTEYDRDSEAIDPLVPHFAEPMGQSPASAGQTSTDAQRTKGTQPSHLDQTPYYTWDVEMIEPLVPIIANPLAEEERR